MKTKKDLQAEIANLEERLRIENEKRELEIQRKKLTEGLPHLFGDKFYKWQREFWESRDKKAFLTAGNQLGKSSINIRRDIHWATEKSLWKELWPIKPIPRVFWYLYPDKSTVTTEFYEKWEPEFLPRGEFKSDPIYGWEMEKKQGEVHAIHWNSGVSQYFKTYKQDVDALQAGTVWKLSFDEELPWGHVSELLFRINATDGYMSGVFTATKAQIFWKRVMEGQGAKRHWPESFRRTVSAYDCLEYEDGSSTPWSIERIRKKEQECGSQNEIDKRIHGKFVRDEGRLVEAYNPDLHLKPAHPLPKEWLIFAAVDMGSGGAKNHPAAITFVSVKPDLSQGRVIKFWRGDGIETAASDVLKKFREMRGEMKPVQQRYDHASKDFGIIAERMGESFIAADKDRDKGRQILNTLFKNNMLQIFEDDESLKLSDELTSLGVDEKKQSAADDGYDSLRYACVSIPWDFKSLEPTMPKPEKRLLTIDEQRRGIQDVDTQIDILTAEFEDANSFYEDYLGE